MADRRRRRFDRGNREPIVAASWSPATESPIAIPKELVSAESWQLEAWAFWDRLGEIHYPTTYKARAVARLEWRVEVNGATLDDDAADELLARATNGLGEDEASRLLALNFEVAGAAWYLGFVNVDARAIESVNFGGLIEPNVEEVQWLVLATTTPKIDDIRALSTFQRRTWIQHPVDPRRSDSGVRPALDPARTLVTLRAQERVQSRSRLLTAGVYWLPSEINFPDDEDSFEDDLLAAARASITNEDSPASLVPIVATVPGDRIDQIKHEIPNRPYDDKIHERQDRAGRAIAVAMDHPPELVLGMGDVNHWGQWYLQEDNYRGHIEPVAGMVGMVLEWACESVLGDGSVVTVAPDATRLLSRPPQFSDVARAVELGAVGPDALRRMLGYIDEDAPTPEELAALDAARRAVSLYPGVKPDLQPAQGEPDSPPAPKPVTAAAADDAPDLGSALVLLDAELRGRCAGALEQARLSVRSRLGARLRTSLRNAGRADDYKDVPNGDLVAAVMSDGVDAPIDFAEFVLAGVADAVSSWWLGALATGRDQIAAMADIEIDTFAWDEAAALSADLLIREATTWIVAGLDRTEANLDSGASEIARRAVSVAGGGAV